jgi:molybdate transport system ATP-binding protein
VLFHIREIILGMERYAEIPDAITHVLEFAGSAVSFCGSAAPGMKRSLPDGLLNVRVRRDADKAAFAGGSIHVCMRRRLPSTVLLPVCPVAGRQPLIQMNDVNVGWDDHKVLEHLSWSLYPGEHWLIRGTERFRQDDFP